MVRQNAGRDFGAWAHALKIFPEVYQGDTLYFINDSVVGPLDTEHFLSLIAKIRDTEADLIGLTQALYGFHHFQSYFLSFRNMRANASAVKVYWDGVINLNFKQNVIIEYEYKLKNYFEKRGFRCEAIYPLEAISK